MKHGLTYPLMSLLVFLAPATTRAACPDAAAVAAARDAADAQCNCATASDHGQYVKCVLGVANARVKDLSLPRKCKRALMQCALKSTCGLPGFVTCCLPRNGGNRCKPMREATCTAKGGTAGTCPSCCDACSGGACTTTTTIPGAPPGGSTTTTTTLPSDTTHTVTVGQGDNLTFTPAALTIHAGNKVRWVFASGGHNVVSGTGGTPDGKFCSTNDTNCRSAPLSNAGAAYEHTFTTTGKFPYYCSPHFALGMTGTITVQ